MNQKQFDARLQGIAERLESAERSMRSAAQYGDLLKGNDATQATAAIHRAAREVRRLQDKLNSATQ